MPQTYRVTRRPSRSGAWPSGGPCSSTTESPGRWSMARMVPVYLRAMPGSPTPDAATHPVVAVVAVAVFDGGGGPPVPGRTVVAAGGVIERIGPAGEPVPPAGPL